MAGQLGGVFGATPLGGVKLFGRFVAGGQFVEFAGEFVGAEVGPGVIGNILPGPAFIPIRDAARAGSSIAPEGTTFGHGTAAAAELLGAFIGGASDGGQAGIVSSGEPALAGGICPRVALGNKFVDALGTLDGIKST